MKIKFKSPYISITQFDAVEINDFSILIGKNGCGKTHLLNAIKQGHVEIEGIDKSEIVYYNYNDFTIFTGELQHQPQFQDRKNIWQGHKVKVSGKIAIIKNKIIKQNLTDQTDSLDQFIFKFIQRSDFYYNTYFGTQKDYDLLEECKESPNGLEEIYFRKQSFTPHFFNFIHQYVAEGRSINSLSSDKIEPVFEKIKNSIVESLMDDDEWSKFLKDMLKHNSVFRNNANDFESPNLFLEDIANEEKEYQFLKTQNLLNKVKTLNYNESLFYLDDEDFIKRYGLSPIEQINIVLSEYDCNGYVLYTNPNQQFLGVDKKNIKVQISLNHIEKGYTTDFDMLSSGEKTLIALSLFIYKTGEKRIIPRVLLLDEVDSSLHPSNINRLLSVIQNLFIKEQGYKVIMATHSPTTVALSPEESIYIIENNGFQKIKKENKANAINVLTEGFATLNEENTNIGINYNITQTNLPVLFTEGITDKIILEIAWSKLFDAKMPFFIQDCFDAPFLGNLFRRAEDAQDGIFINYPDKIFIALFDFDQEGYNVWNGLKKKYTFIEENPKSTLTIKHNIKNAYALLLPVPENEEIIKQVIRTGNDTYKHESILSIELLFYGIDSLNHFFKKEQMTGGGEIIEFKGNKREFANSLRTLRKDDFKNLVPLFKKLEEIISTSHNPQLIQCGLRAD